MQFSTMNFNLTLQKTKEFILTYIRKSAHTDGVGKDTFTKEGIPLNIGYMRRRRHNQKMYRILMMHIKNGLTLQEFITAQHNPTDFFDVAMKELIEEKLLDVSDDGMWVSLTPEGGRLAKSISRFFKI